MSTVEDFLYPEDPDRFESISYNKQDPYSLPEYARGKVLNRYGDILPNPRTIVKLSQDGNDPSSTYINANYVINFFGAKGWIAAQGPTPRTLPAFARMLWEQNIKTIVMLTKLKEGTKQKCEPYFPAKANSTIRFESIEVTLKKTERKDGYVENTLILSRGGQQRTVTQFWYTNWPDHGVPTDGSNQMYTREMILLVLTVRAHRKKVDKMKTPAVVHCSAGVGRTGAFIAIDQAIDAYKQRVKVDINDCVIKMRQCRMALIQHTTQYCFVWAAARDYISGKLELKAAKIRGTQPSAPKGSVPTAASPERLQGSKAGDLFRVTEDFDNPDGNDGVLLVKAGDIVELIEQSDLWWWMRREHEEGWVLPDVIEPLIAKKVAGTKPPVPDASKKPTLTVGAAANPFANGVADKSAARSASGSVNNPFETPAAAPEPPVAKPRPASNPFQAASPAAQRNSNPFNGGGEVLENSNEGTNKSPPVESKSPNPFLMPDVEDDDDLPVDAPSMPMGADPFMGGLFDPTTAPAALSAADKNGTASATSLLNVEGVNEPLGSAVPSAEPSRVESRADSPLPDVPESGTMSPVAAGMGDGEGNGRDAHGAHGEGEEADTDAFVPSLPEDMAMLTSKLDELHDSRGRSSMVSELDVDGDQSMMEGVAVPVMEGDDQGDKVDELEHGEFYSSLQPFTYVTADGTVGTLFNTEDNKGPYTPPNNLDVESIRLPEEIVGPAVVSHDHSWRMMNDASVFASARKGAMNGDHSDTDM
eukprot:m.23359 g.23359  ORF g.23359 m.23359 type:complete len:759 (-) comp4073_c0_seq1:89-2365(-)